MIACTQPCDTMAMFFYKSKVWILISVLCGGLMAFGNLTEAVQWNPPEWKDYPVDVNTTVGEEVKFQCSLTGLDPDGPKPRWEHTCTRNGETETISQGTESFHPCCEVYGDQSNGEYNMHIKYIEQEHEGVWKCTHVLAEPQTRGATVRVKEKPRWNDCPRDINTTVGEEVKFQCSLTGLDPDGPKPRWELTRNGETRTISQGMESFFPPYEVRGDQANGEYHMHIKDAQAEDEGIWKCCHVQAEPQTQSAILTVADQQDVEPSGQLKVIPNFTSIIISTVVALMDLGFNEVMNMLLSVLLSFNSV